MKMNNMLITDFNSSFLCDQVEDNVMGNINFEKYLKGTAGSKGLLLRHSVTYSSEILYLTSKKC